MGMTMTLRMRHKGMKMASFTSPGGFVHRLVVSPPPLSSMIEPLEVRGVWIPAFAGMTK